MNTLPPIDPSAVHLPITLAVDVTEYVTATLVGATPNAVRE